MPWTREITCVVVPVPLLTSFIAAVLAANVSGRCPECGTAVKHNDDKL